MSASGASEALAVLEERGGKRAVLAGLGVRVPNLLISTSHAGVAIVIGEASGASTLFANWVED